MFWSILFFAAIIYLLGISTLLLALGGSRMSVETHVLSTGVGLAAFASLAVLLNTVGRPLVWWVFLASALVLAALAVFRRLLRAKPAPAEPPGGPFWTKDSVGLLVATALAAILALVYLHGALSTPWLEDDDSWVHATSAEYVTVHHAYSISPVARTGVLSYLEPYPPAYPVLMGVLHQLNHSLFLTLKVFNVLIVSLGILYFYLMAREWTGRPALALWMTGVLWAMPCFMSRFIWAQSMSLVLFFPAFYAMERSRREPRWAVVLAIVIGGMFLTQPSSAAIFAAMAGISWLVKVAFAVFRAGERPPRRSHLRLLAAGLAGLVLAATFYFPAYLKFGREGFLYGIGRFQPAAGLSMKVAGTSIGHAYGISDFLWSDAFRNKINQPTGLGPALFLVLGAGVVLLVTRPRRLRGSHWHVTALLWLVFTVLGLEGDALPVSLFPHRFWAFFAIPAAMIAGEFFSFLASDLDWKNIALAIGLGLALGIALIFGGVVEIPRGVPAGLRLGIFVIGLAGTVGGLVAGSLRLSEKKKSGEKTRSGASSSGLLTPFSFACGRFFGLAVLVAGVLVTGGYPKASIQGIIEWPPGVFFYLGTTSTDAGEPAYVQQHLDGYLELRRTFPPGTPIFCVTGTEEHLIGFDMYSPPYDVELRRFTKDLEGMSPKDLDAGVLARVLDVARRKGFECVLLDFYWAAEIQFDENSWNRRLVQRCGDAGITEARFNELFVLGAPPTERETPFLASIQECRDHQRRLMEEERIVVEKVQRLRQLMSASPELSRALDSGPFGVAVFALK